MPEELKTVCFDQFRLDPELGCLFRSSEVVPLTPTEYKLLLLLVQHRGAPVSKAELHSSLWPDTFVDDNNLSQHIRSLRNKLGSDSKNRTYIQTLPRVGYCFRADQVQDTVLPVNGDSAAHLAETATENLTAIRTDHLIQTTPQKRRWFGRKPLVWAIVLFTLVLGGIATYIRIQANHRNHPAASSIAWTNWRGPRILRTIQLPSGASQVVLSPHRPLLYVAEDMANLVQIINLQTDAILQSIPVLRPSYLAASPDGSQLYIASRVKNLTVFDLTSSQTTIIETGNGPVEEIAVAPDGKRLYLAMGYLVLLR